MEDVLFLFNQFENELNTELAEIERGLETASKNLSNMEKFVDRAMLMCCQLGDLFNTGNFSAE